VTRSTPWRGLILARTCQPRLRPHAHRASRRGARPSRSSRWSGRPPSRRPRPRTFAGRPGGTAGPARTAPASSGAWASQPARQRHPQRQQRPQPSPWSGAARSRRGDLAAPGQKQLPRVRRRGLHPPTPGYQFTGAEPSPVQAGGAGSTAGPSRAVVTEMVEGADRRIRGMYVSARTRSFSGPIFNLPEAIDQLDCSCPGPLMHETAERAHVFLPRRPSRRGGPFTNSERRSSACRRPLAPPGLAPGPDWWISPSWPGGVGPAPGWTSPPVRLSGRGGDLRRDDAPVPFLAGFSHARPIGGRASVAVVRRDHSGTRYLTPILPARQGQVHPGRAQSRRRRSCPIPISRSCSTGRALPLARRPMTVGRRADGAGAAPLEIAACIPVEPRRARRRDGEVIRVTSRRGELTGPRPADGAGAAGRDLRPVRQARGLGGELLTTRRSTRCRDSEYRSAPSASNHRAARPDPARPRRR